MLGGEIGNLIIVLVCLLLSAFFSSSEAALLSVLRTARLAHLVSTGSANAARVAQLLKEPGRLLSTILLGNNLANVAFATLVTVITLSVIEDEGIAILVATAVGTAVLLVFGEIIPKNFAVQHTVSVAFLLSRPLKWIELLFWPLVMILQWFSRIATIGGREPGVQPTITEAELRTLIEMGDAEGAIEPKEAEMLESVFRFGDREVRDMMTPRTEIVFLERGTTMGEFLSIYAEHAHTRFPVYKGSTDNIVGILSAKDILRALSARGVGPLDAVTDVIRDAHFVPETKRIAELFDELRDAARVDFFTANAGKIIKVEPVGHSRIGRDLIPALAVDRASR